MASKRNARMRKQKPAQQKFAQTLQRVELLPETALHVEVPKDHVPVVVPDHETNTVKIVPARKKSWWQSIFD